MIVRMVPVATCERNVSGSPRLCGWCVWLHVNVLFQEIRKSRILLGKAGIIKEDEEDKEEVG